MTTTADRTGIATPADLVLPAPRGSVDLRSAGRETTVAVLGEPTRTTASQLSCRLHQAIAGAAAGGEVVVVVVDLGAASAADPAIERVLVCARECATSRGLGFVVR